MDFPWNMPNTWLSHKVCGFRSTQNTAGHEDCQTFVSLTSLGCQLTKFSLVIWQVFGRNRCPLRPFRISFSKSIRAVKTALLIFAHVTNVCIFSAPTLFTFGHLTAVWLDLWSWNLAQWWILVVCRSCLKVKAIGQGIGSQGKKHYLEPWKMSALSRMNC